MLSTSVERHGKNLNGSYVRGRMNNLTPKILIVDDDEDSRLMLNFLLETWSYQVIEARDGIEAVRVAETERPDLILMDVKLPRLDGFDVTRRIRQSEQTGGVPIVFLSGCAEPHYRNAAIEVGGNDYLVKPLDFDKLENTLDKYIDHSRKNSTENSSPADFYNKGEA